MFPRTTAAVQLATVLAVLLTACSATGSSAAASKKVVIATHDSWAAPKQLISQFETQSGYNLTTVPDGDAGQLTNTLVLTEGSPIADGVYGIDNTFATRAIDAGVLAAYRSPDVPPGASAYDVPGGAQYLTPVDWADVCVNVDDAWFAKHGISEPTSLDDLIKPAYKNLFVAPGAATSSPGFAFLLTTIAKYGNGWQNYWKALVANGITLTSGWDEAFDVDYTAGGGNGDRPIVLSYNSDPVDTIPAGGTKPTTHALLNTCYREVEYAGVLAGSQNPAGAEAFINFLESRQFQQSLPANMYVFPVDPQASLPPAWAKWAKPAPTPWSVAASLITANRQQWLTAWGDITG
jgi:thiamine transport system substrate-binding protein